MTILLNFTWRFIVFGGQEQPFSCNFTFVGASGNLWERLAKKMRNTTLKTEAPVDYSLRMERLLFRSGWAQGFWKPQLVARHSQFVVSLRGKI